ncbi:MAG: ElyC/SanA/YdcF family protein [Lamprobacter sp.]|uniref:SanA/YdcF family protein n=1 Tax=Lamprobacter sp. TaxID=3100796 RepID=UPI002B25B8EE|nr:ElyC/SanA/YdcF family protein [Lamprobacter sp.]MEA3638554.1 ElyC/SanA/YdcF family protein [Lamprobacter sp.]
MPELWPRSDTEQPPSEHEHTTAAAVRLRLWRKRIGRGLSVLLISLASLVVTLLLIDLGISLSTRCSITDQLDQMQPAEVALILGTSRGIRGRPNPFYQARIAAAAELYHNGKVRGILVSGDNATRYYNEPVSMQKDLIALGVPADSITLDYAGFRTLDSMVRAKEVFGLDEVLVVSQRFHAARAIFLGRQFGIDARGYAAADPRHIGYLKVRTREILARAAAVLDVLTGQGPRFLGEPEMIRLRDDAEPALDLTPKQPDGLKAARSPDH